MPLLFLGACASPDETERAAPSTAPVPEITPSPGARDKETVEARIIDTDFVPATIRVAPGSSVQWRQIGDQPHSVTAVDESFDSSPECGPVDSDRCLGMGDLFENVFEAPGTYEYYCRVHGLPDGTGMTGTVVVK